MNYTTIEIEGKTIGLKFGMASFRYLQGKLKSEISFNGNELTEIGFAQILYSGYFNNCIIKDVVPEYNFEFFVDFVEKNLNNSIVLDKIKNVIELWTNNDILKSAESKINDNSKKKIIRGKK